MKTRLLFMIGALIFCGAVRSGFAQQTAYQQTNLVGNAAGVGNNTDANLSNPWGIAYFPNQPFWIADNNSGFSTLYDNVGNVQPLVVTIPTATVNPCSPGCPTGIVANTVGGYFGGGAFLFDTEDGILASWSSGTTATKVFDNSATGAVYKGLALDFNGLGYYLLLANFNSGKIDVLNSSFTLTTLSGNFTDPKLPAGYAPHGVHVIGSNVYVAYGQQDSLKHDPVAGAGLGLVDVFDLNGNFMNTLVPVGGALNAPWAVTLAPSGFGNFGGDLLIGNFGDGTINAYDPSSGTSLGQLLDVNGIAINNPGVWDMVFGGGSLSGDPNTMYFTAGGSTQTTGVFASLAAVEAGSFTLTASAAAITVTKGSSGSLMVSATGANGFTGEVSLACSAPPSGVTCAFSPTSITPGSPSTLTVSVASTSAGGYFKLAALSWLPFSLGLVVCTINERSRRNPLSKALRRLAGMSFVGLMILAALLLAGCGSSSMSGNGSSSGGSTTPVTLTIAGTSGTMSQSTTVTININ